MPKGGLYLTRNPEAKLHPDDEDTLPWDAVGVLWKRGVRIGRVPLRPSIEGTLRVGNRQVGTETVILVLEDAIPHVESAGDRVRQGLALGRLERAAPMNTPGL
jgi:hypothetical protein